MTPPRLHTAAPRRAILVASIATGAAAIAGVARYPIAAIVLATIAAAAALITVRHLVNLEGSR